MRNSKYDDRPTMSQRFTLHLATSDKERFARAAASAGVSMSDFARRAMANELNRSA